MDHRSHNNEPEPLHPCLLPDHAYILRRVRDCFIYNKWFFTDWESFLPFLFVLLIFVVLALHNYHRLYMEVPDVL